jgi:hypothetical protein
MKKHFAFVLIGLMIVSILASCGSSKKGNCDAYGSLDNSTNVDVASK